MSTESHLSQSKNSYGVTKLDDKNYLGWVYDIQFVLEEHEVWSIVNGDETAPAIDDESSKAKIAAAATWNKRKAKAMNIIALTIERRQQQPIRATRDPKEAWDILQRLNAAKGIQRSNKLRDLQKSPTTSLTDHENAFRDILEEMYHVRSREIYPTRGANHYVSTIAPGRISTRRKHVGNDHRRHDIGGCHGEGAE
jgi:hypothetical protein